MTRRLPNAPALGDEEDDEMVNPRGDHEGPEHDTACDDPVTVARIDALTIGDGCRTNPQSADKDAERMIVGHRMT